MYSESVRDGLLAAREDLIARFDSPGACESALFDEGCALFVDLRGLFVGGIIFPLGRGSFHVACLTSAEASGGVVDRLTGRRSNPLVASTSRFQAEGDAGTGRVCASARAGNNIANASVIQMGSFMRNP